MTRVQKSLKFVLGRIRSWIIDLARRFSCLRLISNGVHLHLIALHDNYTYFNLLWLIKWLGPGSQGMMKFESEVWSKISNDEICCQKYQQNGHKSAEPAFCSRWERQAKNLDGNWRRFRNSVTPLTLWKTAKSIFKYPTSFSTQFSMSSRSV